MATKEDILEQVVEEYLIHQGYFVQHNVKFLPRRDHPDFVSNQDSNHSDIDVLGFHPAKSGPEQVVAVSCKSWQQGFSPASEIAAIEGDKTLRGRKAWKAFRELTVPKWSEAFIAAVEEKTGRREFTYVTAIAKLRGPAEPWETHPGFRAALGGNPIRILTFQQMIRDLAPDMSTTLAATEVGRLLQMFAASGFNLDQTR
jgi:hypothetical protein